jgi:hypothetical protein
MARKPRAPKQTSTAVTVTNGSVLMVPAKDNVTESWCCIDCGVNTAPGIPPGPLARLLLKENGTFSARFGADSEIYAVKKSVWRKAGMEPLGGCLCVRCLEQRLGHKLRTKDFNYKSPFENTRLSLRGTALLLDRRGKRQGFL